MHAKNKIEFDKSFYLATVTMRYFGLLTVMHRLSQKHEFDSSCTEVEVKMEINAQVWLFHMGIIKSSLDVPRLESSGFPQLTFCFVFLVAVFQSGGFQPDETYHMLQMINNESYLVTKSGGHKNVLRLRSDLSPL